MKRLAIAILLLNCLLAGCEVSVKPSTPDGGNSVSDSAASDRVVQAINAFEAKMATLGVVSKGYSTSLRATSEGLRIAKEINPYHPPGVDPELAAAIRKVKDTQIALFEANMASFGGNNRLPFEEERAVQKAIDDYNEVRNRMVIKYNIQKK